MKLAYLNRFRDWQGTPRRYVRNPTTRKAVPITAGFGTAEFMTAYRAALIDLELAFLPNKQPARRQVMHRHEEDGWTGALANPPSCINGGLAPPAKNKMCFNGRRIFKMSLKTV